jgi:UDP-GlcNAc:undecaprenyl-phosphate GlcNAc-1-phosphate transferase
MVFTVLVPFLMALALSLLITPWVGRVARRRGLVDLPSRRKIHLRPVPRVGGIAMFLAFALTFGGSLLVPALRRSSVLTDLQIAGLLGGGALIFGLGLLDDLRGLSPGLKFAVQAGVGLVAYVCGIGIHSLLLPGFSVIQLGVLSLPVTIFWFVLVINAFNLIDGLDGLAAGITVFSSVVLLVLGLLRGGPLVCVGLASLAGASLGFLRYNFNPATIFMGDCGSYFIGFILASLSILGSIKTQASVTILIPIIALGLPLMEAVWSGIRRFLMGQELFRADNDHLHHRLLKLGFTHRKAVLVLYGFTLTLGFLALLLVQANDRVASIILVGIGLTAVVVIRRLGYIDYLTTEKFLGWARDVSAAIGVDGGGRTFLGLQVALTESASLDELWRHLQATARYLRMDSVGLELNGAFGDVRFRADLVEAGRSGTVGEFDALTTLKISMPVGDADHRLGCLMLARCLDQAPPEYHVLRRMEHVRRTTSQVLLRLQANGRTISTGRPVLLSPRAHRPSEPAHEIETALLGVGEGAWPRSMSLESSIAENAGVGLGPVEALAFRGAGEGYAAGKGRPKG